MQSSAIPSIETPLAGPQVSASPALASGVGNSSVFCGIVQEFLQRGNPGDAGSAADSLNASQGTNGTAGTKFAVSSAQGASTAVDIADVRASATLGPSQTLEAMAAAPLAFRPDKSAAGAGVVTPQGATATRSAALDLAIGKNVVSSSPAFEELAASDVPGESGAVATSNGKRGQPTSAGYSLSGKSIGATPPNVNTGSSLRAAAAANVPASSAPTLALPTSSTVLQAPLALSFPGATNAGDDGTNQTNAKTDNAGITDVSDSGTLPGSSATSVPIGAETSPRAPSQPGRAFDAGSSFFKAFTSAAAAGTSSTSLADASGAATALVPPRSVAIKSHDAPLPPAEQSVADADEQSPAKASVDTTVRAVPPTSVLSVPTIFAGGLVSVALATSRVAPDPNRDSLASVTPATEAAGNVKSSSDTPPAQKNTQISSPLLLQPAGLLQADQLPQAVRLPQPPTGIDIRPPRAADPALSTYVGVAQSATQKNVVSPELTPSVTTSPELSATGPRSSTSNASPSTPNTTLAATSQHNAITGATDNSHSRDDASGQQNPSSDEDTTITGPAISSTKTGLPSTANPVPDSGNLSASIAAASDSLTANATVAVSAAANASASSASLENTAGMAPPLAVPFSPHVATPITNAPQSSSPAPDSSSVQTAASPSLPATLDAAARSAFVSNAQLGQSGAHSEMRIAMQADNLGAIELHARVSGDSVGAAITVDRRDAHTMLATELPSLQQALSDKQLRVEQITLLHSPMQSTSGEAGASPFGNPGQQGQAGGRGAQSFVGGGFAAAPINGLPSVAAFRGDTGDIFDAQGRLSVHA